MPKIYETTYARNATFEVADRDLIVVYQSQDIVTCKWQPAGVNWSACGTVSPELATEFMKALTKAVKLAKKWTAEKEATNA